ncbi:MAG: hypothetical protein QM651_01175 [Rhodoblastus sp.]
MNAKNDSAKAPAASSHAQANSTAKDAALEKSPLISLKAICSEIKLDPRLAREKLRIAAREPKKFPELAKAHKPRSAWEWVKGSPAEKEARAALSA